MKASTRGMLLSGLVYPGLGQMILGRMASGVILALLATVAFIVFIYCVFERASRLIDQVLPLLADKGFNVAALKELLYRDSGGGWGVEKICLVGLAGCWLFAIGHAYVVGKKMDQQSR
jgi:hypothetical protein